MSIFRKSRSVPAMSFIGAGDGALGQIYAVEQGRGEHRADALFVAPAERLDQLYDAGIPQEALNLAVNVAQKSKNWIRLQFASQLLSKIEECSPDILFDLEKKFEFTGLVTDELGKFSGGFVAAAAGLDEAIREENDKAAAAYAGAALQMIVTFLGRMDVHYQDFGHFFGSTTYNQFRTKLNTMKVADRRLIDAFFTQFQTSVSVMKRVFETEIPSANAGDGVDLEMVFRWLSQVSGAVSNMYDAAYTIVKA